MTLTAPDLPPFEWTPLREQAALMLAQGYTIVETAAAVGCNEKTIDRLKRDRRFMEEVDRLSVMVGLASRAERLRIAQRLARQRIRTGEDGSAVVESKADLLDVLRYIQSETHGIKLDLTALIASLATDDAPVAGARPGGVPGASGGETPASG